MAEHLAKAPQIPAGLLHFNGCSIDQQVYAVCYSGITCPALREEANTKPALHSCASLTILGPDGGTFAIVE